MLPELEEKILRKVQADLIKATRVNGEHGELLDYSVDLKNLATANRVYVWVEVSRPRRTMPRSILSYNSNTVDVLFIELLQGDKLSIVDEGKAATASLIPLAQPDCFEQATKSALSIIQRDRDGKWKEDIWDDC